VQVGGHAPGRAHHHVAGLGGIVDRPDAVRDMRSTFQVEECASSNAYIALPSGRNTARITVPSTGR